MVKQYIALIQEGFVRDTQFFAGDPADPDIAYSDDWVDAKRPELFIGIVEGETEDEALSRAAERAGCHKACLRLVAIDSIIAKEEKNHG